MTPEQALESVLSSYKALCQDAERLKREARAAEAKRQATYGLAIGVGITRKALLVVEHAAGLTFPCAS